MILGDTGFVANIGHVQYEKVDSALKNFYSIDVEYRKDMVSYVCFQRDIPLSQLPNGFIDDLDSVVSYEEKSRVVKFAIGSDSWKYILPSK